MAIAGLKVKLLIKDATTGKVLGGQKSATLNRSAETIEATAKDSEGGWKEFLTGMKEWSIDADGVYIADDAAYGLLETAFIAGTAVDCYLEFEGTGTTTQDKYEGQALITDFPLEAPYDDVVSYSLSLQGTGALTFTAGA